MTGLTQGRSFASAGPAFRLALDLTGVPASFFEGVRHWARAWSFEGVPRERASEAGWAAALELGVRVRPARDFAGVEDWGMMLSRWV